MNKAEEQYLYQQHYHEAIVNLSSWGWDNKSNRFRAFSTYLKDYCDYSITISTQQATKDYLNTILNAIKCNVITDWPSFVTYMTGETYEKEGVATITMKCTQCGTALNELMAGRCSQPSHEVPIVLCETCCQASPDCVGCKAQDCDGYVKGAGDE